MNNEKKTLAFTFGGVDPTLIPTTDKPLKDVANKSLENEKIKTNRNNIKIIKNEK